MKRIFVEVADSESKRSYGLMNRKILASNRGMVFNFPYNHFLSFWMKNTYIPLDIAFISENGKIFQIESMNPLSTRVTSSVRPCKCALEVNRDWFKKNEIAVGSLVCGEGITHKKGQQLRYAQVIPQGVGTLDNTQNLLEGFGGAETPPGRLFTMPQNGEQEGQMGEQEQMGQQDQVDQQGQPKENPEVDYIRDMRTKIQYAQDNNKQMEIVYWTLGGNVLPPRKLAPVPREGYPIHQGPNGDFLVAVDVSPTIQGAGWVIPGMQTKSFLLNNIVSLELVT